MHWIVGICIHYLFSHQLCAQSDRRSLKQSHPTQCLRWMLSPQLEQAGKHMQSFSPTSQMVCNPMQSRSSRQCGLQGLPHMFGPGRPRSPTCPWDKPQALARGYQSTPSGDRRATVRASHSVTQAHRQARAKASTNTRRCIIQMPGAARGGGCPSHGGRTAAQAAEHRRNLFLANVEQSFYI